MGPLSFRSQRLRSSEFGDEAVDSAPQEEFSTAKVMRAPQVQLSGQSCSRCCVDVAHVRCADVAQQSLYAPLLELLPGSSLLVINALCVSAVGQEESTVLRSVCYALDAYEMLHDTLLRYALFAPSVTSRSSPHYTMRSGIVAEVAKTTDAATLFRSNTAATKLVGAWVKLSGQVCILSISAIFLNCLRRLILTGCYDLILPHYRKHRTL